mmetsp:Transcript_1806/g.2597  ORF Transcript_1806/g.2597 Transcript_1806/m.2597 type:complete len:378 (-) Transcript_1806:224-1357(-)
MAKGASKEVVNIDDILDAALDELDNDSSEDENGTCNNFLTETEKNVHGNIKGPINPTRGAKHDLSSNQHEARDDEEAMFAASLDSMMKSLVSTGNNFDDFNQSIDNPEELLKNIISDMETQISSSMQDSSITRDADNQSKTKENLNAKFQTKANDTSNQALKSGTAQLSSNSSSRGISNKQNSEVKKDGEDKKNANKRSDVDNTVEKLLNEMSKACSEDQNEGYNPENIEGMGEDIMNEMMREFDMMGQKGDADNVLNGMMRQLLSKDLMYEPMKQVCDKFPQWLAEKKDLLSDQDYNRYGTQYQYFQRIVDVYETDPDNFARLVELMQDIQEFGQPPAEIIKELAPDLEFDEEGMPNIGNMGITGMPPGNENCSIM